MNVRILVHTWVRSHAESEYELMASMTSESTTTTSTSQTWFGYHAKGSGWANAVDREAGIIGGTSAAGVYYRYATGGSDYLAEMGRGPGGAGGKARFGVDVEDAVRFEKGGHHDADTASFC